LRAVMPVPGFATTFARAQGVPKDAQPSIKNHSKPGPQHIAYSSSR